MGGGFLPNETSALSLTRDPLRSVPHHQQSDPADQPAQEAGLPDPGLGHRLLHHSAPALRFTLSPPVRCSLLNGGGLSCSFRDVANQRKTELCDWRKPRGAPEQNHVGLVHFLMWEQNFQRRELLNLFSCGGKWTKCHLPGAVLSIKMKRTRNENRFLNKSHVKLVWGESWKALERL